MFCDTLTAAGTSGPAALAWKLLCVKDAQREYTLMPVAIPLFALWGVLLFWVISIPGEPEPLDSLLGTNGERARGRVHICLEENTLEHGSHAQAGGGRPQQLLSAVGHLHALEKV